MPIALCENVHPKGETLTYHCPQTYLRINLQIVAVASLLAAAECSFAPALRYTHVAPPSVLPFSAQVSTFTRNLHVFDAPYAAGVIPGPPAIVQRAILPAPVAPLAPAPFLSRAAPVLPAPYPGYPYINPYVHGLAPAVAPASLLG